GLALFGLLQAGEVDAKADASAVSVWSFEVEQAPAARKTRVDLEAGHDRAFGSGDGVPRGKAAVEALAQRRRAERDRRRISIVEKAPALEPGRELEPEPRVTRLVRVEAHGDVEARVVLPAIPVDDDDRALGGDPVAPDDVRLD